MPERVCEVCGRAFTQVPGRPARRCPHHRRYGAEHQAARAAGIEQAYGTACCRCGRPLMRGQVIHLDHNDSGQGYRGWSHEHCNTAAGAAKGNAARAAAYRKANGLPVRASTASTPPARTVLPPVPLPPGPPRPDPSIRHSPDCRCGGAVFYPGPGPFWTSRCW